MAAKPNVNEIWASAGAVLDPGVPKIQLGWVAEVPTFQNFNFILNRQDKFNAHINEQGIAVHDLVTPYPAFAWAKGSDGIVYVAKQANTGEDPVTDVVETFWEPLALGGGALGGGSNKVFYENDTNVTDDYTITAGQNAMTAGPVEIDNGSTVTVPTGSVWTVV